MAAKKKKGASYVPVKAEKIHSDYELVPQRKFLALEKEVVKILENPLIHEDKSKNLLVFMETLNDSIVSLLEVLVKINKDTSFEEKEEEYIRKQIKPIAQSVKEIKNQNETIATGMINIIDRLNEIQKQIYDLKDDMLPRPSTFDNPSLPPLTEGPAPPDVSFQSSPPPFGQSVDGNAIPPLGMGDLGKKKSLFR